MKFLLLVLLSQQQLKVPVDLAAIRQPDGGVVQVIGGTWFAEVEVIDMGKDHAALRAENENLKAHVSDVPYKWVIGATSVGIVLGAVLGFTAGRAAPR